MRHKYETRGIVLSRSPVGEASAFVTILTPDLGLVRSLSQGVRKSGAKLAHSLATFSESDVVLVRGKDGWRLAGAVLAENWFAKFGRVDVRERAGRICNLLLRLVAGEASDRELFSVIRGFFYALTALEDDTHEAAEILAALRILAVLGFDEGGIRGDPSDFTRPLLAEVLENRIGYIARVNNDLAASDL
ncbi:recombination protein O N-terminal domain-containing protein [Candidatus Kaiserbacteria bacterium]|nr:recombination protein O N-terminal domain-containing protein [Candidatus Kaiserbacteria bacterium]